MGIESITLRAGQPPASHPQASSAPGRAARSLATPVADWLRAGARLNPNWRLECREAAVGTLVVVALSAFVPALQHFQPHPLWIVVLAIAVRYGLPSGYLASGVSALGYLLLALLHADSRDAALSAHGLVQPFLMLTVGVLVGEVAQARKQRLLRAERAASVATARLDQVVANHRATLQVKAELEQRISSQPASVITLYETAKRLETLHSEELYPAILELLSEFLHVEASALYLRQGQRFTLRATYPAGGQRGGAGLLNPSGIVGRAVRERRVVTLRDRLHVDGPDTLAQEPVMMAGPLLGRDGEVQGVVIVERMPFLKFSPSSVRLFELILDWSTSALSNAAQFEQAVVRATEDGLTGAYTPAHTLRAIRDEFLRARRYGLELSVIVAQINDFARIPRERVPELHRQLGLVFRRNLREVDLIGHHPEPDSFALILPMTGLEGARVIAGRIDAELAAAGLRPYDDKRVLSVRLGVSGLSGEATNAEVYNPTERVFHSYAGVRPGPPSTLPDVAGCWRDPDEIDEAPAA